MSGSNPKTSSSANKRLGVSVVVVALERIVIIVFVRQISHFRLVLCNG